MKGNRQETLEAVIWIKVIPQASCNEIVGWEEGMLKIRIKAAPEKGEANQELIRFLAKVCGIRRESIKILSGEKGRKKRICVKEYSLEQLYVMIESRK